MVPPCWTATAPLLALTLRHDRIDNFWFALLHELMHVQKHLKPEHSFVADNLDDKMRTSIEEQQADQGAQEGLDPESHLEASEVCINPTMINTHALADQLRIHPAIVAGRVRHHSNNWRPLKRHCRKRQISFENSINTQPNHE